MKNEKIHENPRVTVQTMQTLRNKTDFEDRLRKWPGALPESVACCQDTFSDAWARSTATATNRN